MSIIVKLNLERKYKNGYYPVIIQLIVHRSRTLFYTGFLISPEEFKQGKIIYLAKYGRTKQEVKKMNVSIQQLTERIRHLVTNHPEYEAKHIKKMFSSYEKCKTLFELFDKEIRLRNSLNHFGTGSAYKSTFSSIKNFLSDKDVPVTEVDLPFIRKYKEYLESRGIGQNSISFYLRNFRTVINRYYSDKNMDCSHLYRGLKMSGSTTQKRALSHDELLKLINLRTDDDKLNNTIRIFSITFMLRGISFVDLLYLPAGAISDNILSFRRKKTKKPIHIGLSQNMLNILSPLMSNDKESRYLLNFFDGLKEEKDCYNRYKSLLKQYNRKLHVIGNILGFQRTINSYVARHTWATMAKSRGIPVTYISEAMGHSSPQITGIYLKSFNQEILDNVNEEVISPYLKIMEEYQ